MTNIGKKIADYLSRQGLGYAVQNGCFRYSSPVNVAGHCYFADTDSLSQLSLTKTLPGKMIQRNATTESSRKYISLRIAGLTSKN